MRFKYKTHKGIEIERRGKMKQMPRIKITLVNWLHTVDDETRDEVLEIIKHKQ